jgi:lysophospholipase L1-like esterase
MAERPRRRVIVLAAALVLGLSTVIGVGLGEVVVRLVRPQQLIEPRPDIFMPSDSVGWDIRPSVSTTVNTGERTVSWYTDAEGYRIGAAGRVDAPQELLLIGDSFLQALQVNWEQSAAGLLDVSLRKSGFPVAVRNSGVSAWDPPQYATRLRRALAGRKPAAVIVSWYVGNDATGDAPAYLKPRSATTAASFAWPTSLTWPAIVDAWLRPINDVLERRSHLFVMVRQAMLGVRMRVGLAADAVPTEILRREADSPRWARSAAWGDTLVRLARAAGVPIGFVVVPSTYQVHEGSLALYARGNGFDPSEVDVTQPNRRMADALQRLGVPVVDALPAFQSAAKAQPALLYGTVDRHLSPEGNVVFAAALDSVAKQLLTAQRPAPTAVALPPRR